MSPAPHDRLRDGRDVSAVLRGRRQRAGDLVVLHVRDRAKGRGRPRVAVIASRRVGGAVQRNRAKRLLREAARRLPLTDGVDVVLLARAGCADSDLHEVLPEVQRLARRLGVLAVPGGEETESQLPGMRAGAEPAIDPVAPTKGRLVA